MSEDKIQWTDGPPEGPNFSLETVSVALANAVTALKRLQQTVEQLAVDVRKMRTELRAAQPGPKDAGIPRKPPVRRGDLVDPKGIINRKEDERG